MSRFKAVAPKLEITISSIEFAALMRLDSTKYHTANFDVLDEYPNGNVRVRVYLKLALWLEQARSAPVSAVDDLTSLLHMYLA